MSLSRRRFLAASLAAAAAPAMSGLSQSVGSIARKETSLVPAEASRIPNYWCTWATQNYMYGHQLHDLDVTILQGESGGDLARSAMTEQNVFTNKGWAESFYPRIRNDLFFLLDDGWERGGTATF